MFKDDKVKSLFMRSKPRLVDGCCDEVVCCGDGNPQCVAALCYEVIPDGGPIGDQVCVAAGANSATIPITEGDVVNFYVSALTLDATITSVQVTPAAPSWALIPVMLLPRIVTNGAQQLVAIFTATPADDNVAYELEVVTSCGTFTFTVTFDVTSLPI